MGLWPFPRRDKQGDTPAAARPTTETPTRPADVTPRPTGREWTEVPPLERTSGPPPLVAPLGRITQGLAATADSGMVLAPLGHQRRQDAPTGVVSGTIVPTQASARGGRTDGSPLDLRHTPVAAAAPEAQELRWPERRPTQSLAADQSTPRPIASRAAPLVEQGPVRTGSAPQSSAPPVAHLPPAMPLRRLEAMPRAARDEQPAAPAVRPTAGPAQSTPLDVAIVQPPASPAVPSEPASAASGVSTPAPEATPLSGQRTIHRRRLGEPLTHRPSTMVASVSPTSDLAQAMTNRQGEPQRAQSVQAPAVPRPATRDALPVRHSRPSATVDSPQPLPTAVQPRQAAARERPAAPLIGRATPLSAQRPQTELRPAEPRSGAMPVSVSQRRDSGPSVVPITRQPSAAAPSPPTITPPERVPADLRAQLEPMLGADLSDVPVHRGPSSQRAAADMRAKAFTHDTEVHLPEKLGPTSHGEARESLAHELTHVVQQRRLGNVAPNEESAAGAQMETEARNVARRVSTPERVSVTQPVPRRPTVPLLYNTPGRSASGPSAHSSMPSSSLSTAQAIDMAHHIEGAAVAGGMGTRSPAGGVTFGGSPSGTASSMGAQRAPEGESASANQPNRILDAPLPSAQTDQLSPERLDELASRLYDGIRSRLRHDLLVQRERAGALFDNR